MLCDGACSIPTHHALLLFLVKFFILYIFKFFSTTIFNWIYLINCTSSLRFTMVVSAVLVFLLSLSSVAQTHTYNNIWRCPSNRMKLICSPLKMVGDSSQSSSKKGKLSIFTTQTFNIQSFFVNQIQMFFK